LTDEAEKTRGVSRLERVQLIFPFLRLQIPAAVETCVVPQQREEEDGPPDRRNGAEKENTLEVRIPGEHVRTELV
jgi:hypothetical protein